MLSLTALAAAAVVSAAQQPAAPSFDFHSNFWINLHHSLYRAAQPRGPAPRSPVIQPIGALTAEEQREWDAVVAFYRDSVIQHDLLFDERMRIVKTALAGHDDDTRYSVDSVGRGLAAMLNRAAPIYRKHWWPSHDATNRLWISAVQPLVAALGATLAGQLASAYGTPWHAGSIRVDVSPYAGPRLVAYTTGTTDGHIVVSSTDPCDQGYAALETLYHEASHTIIHSNTGVIGATIAAAATAQHVAKPDDLWHALMFYTHGELLRRDLAELGLAMETPTGVCDPYTGEWARYRDALALFWRPRLNGTVTVDSAIARIVRALAESGPP